jgi:predicted hotdog family 3-hydroxylacyl-ACP dehydratase
VNKSDMPHPLLPGAALSDPVVFDAVLRPIEAYVPHRGAMRLLDRLIEASPEHAVAEVRVPVDGLFVREVAGRSHVPAWVGLEYMAQTISAWSGARAGREGLQPRLGFLLGTRRYKASVAEFPCGALLRVEARHEFISDNGLGMFDCNIVLDGVEVATARVSIYEPADGIDFLKPNAAP